MKYVFGLEFTPVTQSPNYSHWAQSRPSRYLPKPIKKKKVLPHLPNILKIVYLKISIFHYLFRIFVLFGRIRHDFKMVNCISFAPPRQVSLPSAVWCARKWIGRRGKVEVRARKWSTSRREAEETSWRSPEPLLWLL